MDNINIKKQEDKGDSWLFLVTVGKREYKVIVNKDYWHELTSRQYQPSELVRKSFEFLLEREPKESILRSFNLRIINKYFPEYEAKIKGVPKD